MERVAADIRLRKEISLHGSLNPTYQERDYEAAVQMEMLRKKWFLPGGSNMSSVEMIGVLGHDNAL